MSLLLRKTINSNSTLQSLKPNNTLSLFLRQSTKHFSTETQPPPPPPPSPPQVNNDPSPTDPFLQDSATSLTYARLHGVRKHTLKTDIINLFEGSNLTLDDIRVVHNRFNYNSYAAAIKFTSRRAYDNAQRALTRAGRVYNLEKTPPTVWDAALRNSYDGKTVLLEGLPKNALNEDIERFLSGCEFVPSSIRTFVKYPDPIMSAGRKNPTTSEEKTGPNTSEEKRDPIRMATVLFSTRNEAMNALIKKNRGFCLNNQISKLMAFRRVRQAEPASFRKIISGDSSVKQESGDQNILSDAKYESAHSLNNSRVTLTPVNQGEETDRQ